MTLRQVDPLLALGRGIVLIGQALMALAALALVLAIPAVALFDDAITVELRREFADPGLVLPTLALVGVMLLGLVVVALVFLFLENLRRIIATVGEGDPFMPVNAHRLTIMAWLMLAVELLMLAMAGIGMRLLEVFEPAKADGESSSFEFGFGFDFSGIILVVTLFILARVFRQGAEMRADLEGTV
jgi:hypothetical protein